jgi:ubiquinone/menaquinone biosynthesis C-methylase UbiE
MSPERVESEAGAEPSRPIEHLPTREGYDRWATIYDDEDNPLIVLEERYLLDLLGDVGGLDVVDLGCGTGRYAVRLAAAGARVTAVDFSEGMVAKARRKPSWESVRFVAHDLTQRLPFADRSFHRVLACLVLDHIGDLAGFFSECRRVCRPDGFLLVSAFHPALMLRGIQARFIVSDAMVVSRQDLLIEAAMAKRLPTMLVINLKAAKSLGLTIPQSILSWADAVIQ